MLEFLNSLSSKTSKADVCIAGAGPAGIVLALTLAKSGISTILLEGGSLDYPGAPELDLYKGESTGIVYPLSASRLRFFGGTSGHWGGWCKPLDRADFDRRPGSDLPSWPLGLDDLSENYTQALDWCEIDSHNFDAAASVENPDKDLLFKPGMAFTQQLFRFSPPTRFGTRYREDIESSELIRCFCKANLVSVEHSNGRIVSAHAVNLEGDSIDIQADHFILAMGGIENTRFLLHTRDNSGVPFGNQSGLLGQCFMEHFGFQPGYMMAPLGLRFYRHQSGDADIQPVITSSEDFQREHDLPAICILASPHNDSQDLPKDYFLNPGTLHTGIDEVSRYQLQMICEPSTSRQSTITLGNERDALGMQRVKLNWHVSDEDYQGVERFTELLGQQLGAHGLGRLQRTVYFEGERRQTLSVAMHHMGSTRMSDDPKYGVVDSDCLVNGTSNLHLASSSVFPRCGYSNPTLTILALADRLANTLAERG